jgi:hypothetical protein
MRVPLEFTPWAQAGKKVLGSTDGAVCEQVRVCGSSSSGGWAKYLDHNELAGEKGVGGEVVQDEFHALPALHAPALEQHARLTHLPLGRVAHDAPEAHDRILRRHPDGRPKRHGLRGQARVLHQLLLHRREASLDGGGALAMGGTGLRPLRDHASKVPTTTCSVVVNM